MEQCALLPEEKQYDDVLYNQHNIGNSSILIRFRPNVQNGTPLSTPPRAQAKQLQICQTTGFGGQPIKAPGQVELKGILPCVSNPSTSRKTNPHNVQWVCLRCLTLKFVPQQREVRVLPGETAFSILHTTNMSDQDIIGWRRIV